MSTPLPVLEEIAIPTPCPAAWDAMSGDGRARFCGACSQPVHNLSAMSRAEAVAFVAANGDGACVRFYRRPDGTVNTDERPKAMGREVSWIRRGLLALVSWLGIGLAAGCESCIQGKPAPPKRKGQEAGQGDPRPDAGRPGAEKGPDGK